MDMSVQIPDFLRKMLTARYGTETTARILDGYTKRRPVTLRANTLKTDAARVKERLTAAGIGWRETRWYPDALILEQAREPEVRALDIYENGEIYLQSLSSMIPPLILEPRAGETILDMAAAPGGKTTQMAALSRGTAQITACEKNYARAERLRYNLARQGAGGIPVLNEDARKLDPFFSFDKILLDAPCSGSGTIRLPAAPATDDALEEAAGSRRRTEKRSRKPDGLITMELIDRSVRTQEALLRKALQLLKPGHEMVYSTCSVLECENEVVLRRVLPGAKAEIVPIEHPMLEELPLLPASIPGTVCVCPTGLYEGFFAAKIRRSQDLRFQTDPL